MLQLHCRNLPGTDFEGRTGVRLGVQKGTDVVDDVPGDVASATFRISLRVSGKAPDGQPNFLGPYAHGTPDKRFLYLCWGERLGEREGEAQGGSWEGFRRAKVHLSLLSWEWILAALESGRALKAVVEMTDDRGGPMCGSVSKDKIQWQRVEN